MTPLLTATFGLAVGLIAANLYALQPLIGLVGPSLGLGPSGATLVSASLSMGYAAGLFLLVPLGDLVESRKLIVSTLGCNAAALSVATVSRSPASFLGASFLVGVTSSVIQMLIPVAAALTPPARRGRTIGNVMMGLMLGILFARPWGSVVGGTLGWRAVDGLAAVAIAALTVVLALLVPEHRPLLRPAYPALVRSMWKLFRDEPVLRYRALACALSFGAFTAFWTTVALRLVQPPFGLGQHGIAVFALAGVGGVFAAPVAGRAGDRGFARPLILAAHASVVVAAVLAGIAGTGTAPLGGHRLLGLAVLSLASIVLDVGVVADQTLGRRAILLLRPEAAGRLNGLFTGSAFVGGGLGAAIAGLAWAHGGWRSTCLLIGTLGLTALFRDCLDRSGRTTR